MLEQLKTDLQNALNEMESKRQSGLDISSDETTVTILKQQIMDAESQQDLEERVEEDIKENGYIFDTLMVDGLTMPEIITDDVQYDYARRGVQILVVGMNTSHSTLINALKEEHRQETEALRDCISAESLRADQMQSDNTDLEVANYQLGLEKDELSEKVKKVAQIQYESDQQIEQQKQHIENLQNQIALGIRGALNVVDMPQDTSKMAAEIIASKPRITNVRFKDEYGIDRRTKLATDVLSGNEIEYQEYVEKRYIILDAEQAEQYRADEANKKAELELQNSIIPLTVPEIPPVNTATEQEAPPQENTFQEEVQAADNGGVLPDVRNTSEEPMVAKESEVITLESLHVRLATVESLIALDAEGNHYFLGKLADKVVNPEPDKSVA